jgi:hypothetical protein
VAYRENTLIEIEDVLRPWLQDRMGLRPIAATASGWTARRFAASWTLASRRGWYVRAVRAC